ncbi:MAG: Alkaline phosphatase (EC [uncultured Thiotrichaceae bacterium]|uniref:Alkaline phosphatase (EC) n=1 Tax=uncultured Thiotrichaceae bacterium TaxID=298394 RepID=A0A6S6UG60_9GAMM|nr:MAG: Alkaline phosphatase (EC [uncultured Thiotrichaceae bacterium]
MPASLKNIAILASVLCLSLAPSLSSANQGQKPHFGLLAPTNDNDKKLLRTAKQITLNGKTQTLKHQLLMKTGYKDNGEIYGALKNIKGELITHANGSPVICNGTTNNKTVYGAGLDFTSFIEQDGKIHMISQFECVAGAMYTVELKQSPAGELSPVAGTLKYIDQSAYKGGWIHCAGSVTPWNSHLGSEEYESDARKIEHSPTSDIKYINAALYFNDPKQLNPYYYGWTPEVKIKNGEAVYTKHYSMGRASHELAYTMPDKKTVYLTDDGSNDGFYRFVADKPEDLSSGTLYAAKWTQTSNKGAGAATLSWVDLGHANHADIKAFALSGTLKFSDIFKTAEPLDEKKGVCPESFTFTNTQTGRECLAVKDINGDKKVDAKDDAIAARLETRRMAAMKGATTEFRKFEGFTYNEHKHKAYIAMSEIERGMEKGFARAKGTDKYDRGGNNDINLTSNPCGAVYELDLDDHFTANSMTAIIEGKLLDSLDDQGNKCHVDHIANPDNVAMIPDTNTLLIAEDTDRHTNNVLWAYNLNTQALERLATVPLNAETTSAYTHHIGKFNYISLVTQHPMSYQETDPSNKENSISVLGPFIIP